MTHESEPHEYLPPKEQTLGEFMTESVSTDFRQSMAVYFSPLRAVYDDFSSSLKKLRTLNHP